MSLDTGRMLFLFVGGIICLTGAVFNWDWFMNYRLMYFIVGAIGRPATRLVYGLLGTALLIGGVIYTMSR